MYPTIFMKNIICCIAAILIISLQSCLSAIANKYKINSKSPKLEKIDVNGKEVYFLVCLIWLKKNSTKTQNYLLKISRKKILFFTKNQ